MGTAEVRETREPSQSETAGMMQASPPLGSASPEDEEPSTRTTPPEQRIEIPQQQAPKPALPKTLTNSIGMEFVLIEAGEFMMGSADVRWFERILFYPRPPHRVTISRAFYLGKYEVTQSQWEAVMGNNPSHFTGDSNLPVEQVSWDDVREFIRKLNEKEGGTKYRLPTEAEWEYACRAGTTTVYSFGDDAGWLGEYAWYGDNSGHETHPVGQLKPNDWGLYDMHGNVWEWVRDWFAADYYKNRPSHDPGGPPTGSSRVRRGGSWGNDAGDCRSTARFSVAPGNRHRYLGFRLLRTVP